MTELKNPLNHLLLTRTETPLNVLVESQLNNAYEKGWQDCKKAVVRLLEQNWTGADLSINSCDEHYIDKIKSL